jgi:hypothetical protein
MKYQALKKVLGQMSPDLKKGLAYGAGGTALAGGLGAGAYDLANPDSFLDQLEETGSDVVENLGEHISDNPNLWLSQLSLLGGSALGKALEQRTFRNNVEQEQKQRYGR